MTTSFAIAWVLAAPFVAMLALLIPLLYLIADQRKQHRSHHPRP